MSRTTHAPTPAERARTVLAAATSVRLGVLELAHEVERHLVARDGSLLMQPGPDSPARVLASGGSLSPWTGTAIAVDVAEVAHADRIRGRVTLTGPVEAIAGPMADHVREHLAASSPSVVPVAGPILRLVPQRVFLERLCGDGEGGADPQPLRVALADFVAATPDLFARGAGEWLDHLDRCHATGLRQLAAQATGGLEDDATARPLLVDRHGLVLRVSGPHPGRASYDVRVAFPRPVMCPCEGSDALDELWARLGSS